MQELDKSFNDYLSHDLQAVETERFVIDSPQLADWAFRKIKENEDKIAEIENYAGVEKNKIDDWLEHSLKEPKNSVNYFQYLLKQYYINLKQNDPEAKLSTPNGKVTSRRRQPKLEFDEEKTLTYLKKAKPELVEVQEKFNKTEVKKLLNVTDDHRVVDEDGELLDFIRATPQEDSFKVTTE